MKKQIPYLLVWTRAAMAILALILALFKIPLSNQIIAWSIPLAVIIKLFDGFMARRIGLSAGRLEHLENQIDLFYWLSILIAFIMCVPKADEILWAWIALSVLGEASLYIVSIWRFGKEPCRHAWMTKARYWLLAVALFYGFAYVEITYILLALIFAFLSQVDVLIILLLIPKWEKKVHSSYHAASMRRGRASKRIVTCNT